MKNSQRTLHAAVKCGSCGHVTRGAPVDPPAVYCEEEALEAMRVSVQKLLRKHGTTPVCPNCGVRTDGKSR